MVNMGENNSEEINMPVFAAFFSSNLLDSSLLQAKHNSKIIGVTTRVKELLAQIQTRVKYSRSVTGSNIRTKITNRILRIMPLSFTSSCFLTL